MCDRADPSQHDAPRRADDPFEHAFEPTLDGIMRPTGEYLRPWCRVCGYAADRHPSMHPAIAYPLDGPHTTPAAEDR